MARVLRILTTLAATVAAFWAYSLLAVPWLEPPGTRSALPPPPPGEANEALGVIRRVFQPGDWELDEKTKVLESDQTKLLWRQLDDLGEGRIRLRPCTIIFVPKSALAGDQDPARQAIVLQSPDGATLQFDKPVDLRKGTFGELKAGRMPGRITVRSGGTLPGPEDDLYLVTSDVLLDQERIWTDSRVDFRLGPNSGSGAQMQLAFAPKPEGKPAGKMGMSFGGVDGIEIRQVERLRLCMNPASGGKSKSAAGATPALAPAGAVVPVEITCRGKFRFDVQAQTARFEDHVTVLQINANGPSDQIICDRLTVFFARRAAKPAPDPPQDSDRAAASLSDLEPRRIEAVGTPVIVNAPSRGAEARGESLKYDLQTGLVAIESEHPEQETYLRQGGSELHAPHVEYQPGPSGTLGRGKATGPGWMMGISPNRPQDKFEARWQTHMRLEPDQDQPDRQHVLSLSGEARLHYGAMGKLAAQKVFCWIEQQEQAAAAGDKKDKIDVRPNCMLARGKVDLDSPRLSGQFEEMTVWFEPATAQRGSPSLPGKLPLEPRGVSSQGGMPWNTGFAGEPSPAKPQGGQGGQGSQGSQGSQGEGGLLAQHVRVAGRLLKARVAIDGEHAEPVELMIEDQVHLEETQTAQPGEKPMSAQGDRIHVFDAAKPIVAATITGNPAKFEARGIALAGANINLNGGTQRVWIEGAGRLDMAVDRDLQGQPVAQPQPLCVQWQKGMELKEARVVFEENVLATTPQQQTRCEALEVLFKEPIRWNGPRTGPQAAARPEPRKLIARGRPGHPVEMEAKEFEQAPQGAGKQVSYQQMRLVDVTMDVVSGEIQGRGPGELTSVRLGTLGGEEFSLLDVGAAGGAAKGRDRPPRAAGSVPPGAEEKALTRLEVSFQHELTGNLHRRQLTFHEQVRAVYGKVASWEARLPAGDPDALGEEGATLRCDEMTVVQLPEAAGRTTVDLEAAGNVVAHGQQYTARASRMTYTQAKGLVVLEGNPRTEAQLFIDDQTQPARAGRILFWPKTRKVDVPDLRSFQLQLPAPPPRPKAGKKAGSDNR